MAIPTRKQQIEAVAKFLDSDRNEGRSLEEIATEIVDGYLNMITPPPPNIVLREGMLIKAPTTNKVYRVAYLRDNVVWAIGETGGYGWLGPAEQYFWQTCEEYRPRKRAEVNGKGKMVEMTDEMIAEAWANSDWTVGDQVSQRQRQFLYEVVAVGPSAALLRNLKTGQLVSDSNHNLEKYYRKEIKGAAEW